MSKDFQLLFFIRNDKKNRRGEVPIYCRITVDGRRKEISIKRHVEPSKWKPGREEVAGNGEHSKEVNNRITTVRTKLNTIQNEFERDGKNYSAVDIKRAYQGFKEKPKTLLALHQDHNDKMKTLIDKDFSKNTHTRYVTSFKHLKEFIQAQYSKDDLPIKEVNYEFLTGYDHFLRTIKNCSNNTVAKYVKSLQKIVNNALANEWISVNPFLRFAIKIEKIDPGYLSMEELDAIRNKQFDIPRVQQVKDVFVFQCYTGTAYSDIKKLTWDNIVLGPSNTLCIASSRTKTKNPFSVPLLPEALEIIGRYKEDPYCVHKGVLLPVLSNQKMNAYLKEIGAICGVKKELHTHLGRHTFGTTITLDNGVSLEALSKMLGNTPQYTLVYGRIRDTRVTEEMRKVEIKMASKNVA